jgi:transcriptional regulator with XRE-family HTH domain
MRFSEYMTKHSLKDEEMAERIGCDRSYVVKLRGGKVPSSEMMATIARRTDGAVQLSDWFDDLPQADEAA